MSNIVMWLGVSHNSKTWGDNGTLYTKTLDTIHVPVPGEDEVSIYFDIENDEDGMLSSVKRRWMDHKGTWHVELTRIHINPSEGMCEAIGQHSRTRLQYGNSIISDRCLWETEDPESLERKMLGDGWVEYNPRRINL